MQLADTLSPQSGIIKNCLVIRCNSLYVDMYIFVEQMLRLTNGIYKQYQYLMSIHSFCWCYRSVHYYKLLYTVDIGSALMLDERSSV